MAGLWYKRQLYDIPDTGEVLRFVSLLRTPRPAGPPWHEVESAVQSRYAVTPSYKVKPRKCAQSSVPLLASHLKTVAAAAQEEEGEEGGAT